ncbi:MAG TPA: cellulose synthase operon protein YhjQ/BcsQ [Bryobacteraceae bacterium]|nr:cellulose synthase operon protein YhjQ/BcsQ [Bryobacteraceae bacterium]
MLKPDALDDVSKLCRSVHIDPSAYVHFELPSMPGSAPASPVADSEAPETEVQDGTELVESEADPVTGPVRISAGLSPMGGVLEVGHLESEQALAPRVASVAFASFIEDRRPAVSSLDRDLSALATIHAPRFQQPTVLPIASAVGSAGVTTLMAGLGRALSITGEQVLLVDASTPSTLDYFYTTHADESPLLLSTAAMSPFEGQVHVLRTDREAAGVSQSWSTKVHRAVAELRGRCDHVLVAGREALTTSITQRAAAAGTCLIVLNPDLRSVLAVADILRAFTERTQHSGQQVRPAFIINRFDESNPAHCENRNLLAAELGSTLLPFCIPDSPVVAQSLSRRVNPIDAAPQSAFADGCFNLAEWYRGTVTTAPLTSSHFEENQLVSE